MMARYRTRLLALAATFAAVSAASASAAPTFEYAFQPAVIPAGSTDEVLLNATVYNIGSTDITGLSGYTASLGSIGAYYTGGTYGSPTESLDDEFDGIDIAPGGSFEFTYAYVDFAGAPTGIYTGLSGTELSLEDASGGTPGQSPADEPLIAVSAAPEPSTWALMITGVGLSGVMLRFGRRRGAPTTA